MSRRVPLDHRGLGTLGINALGTVRLGFVKIPTDLSGRWAETPKNSAGTHPRPAHADPARTDPSSGV
jgi:hypothetical protein